MALFENLKKENVEVREKIQIPFLFLGQDWCNLSLYKYAQEKVGRDQVLVIDNKELHKDHLFFPGPSLNRGPDNFLALKSLFPDLVLKELPEPLFYKDQKLRSFKGKAKPLKIFEDEEFFQETGFIFDKNELFLKEEINYEEVNFRKDKVLKITETDNQNFKFLLSLESGFDVECNHIFFADSLNSLVKLMDKNTHLGSQIHSLKVESFNRPCVVVNFKRKNLGSFEGQYFIPKSQTHERGNLIVEAINDGGVHTVKCFSGIDREEFNEEEISKLIKLLKRNIERVFEGFNSSQYEEKIWCFDSMPLRTKHTVNAEDLPNITLTGAHGILGKDEFINSNFESLKDLNLENIEQDLRSYLFLKSFKNKNFFN